MEQKQRFVSSLLIKILMITGVALAILFCSLRVAAFSGFALINPLPNVVLLVAAIAIGGLLLVLYLKDRIARRTTKVIAMVLVSIVVAGIISVIAMYGIFLASMIHSRHFIYSSPDKTNQVVVVEGGFIDATFNAYPRAGLFYRAQDNGMLSYHDFWGSGNGKFIKVEWIAENEAIVTIEHSNFWANDNSNPDDRIIVQFD